jgi:hypothetical protein
MHRAMQPSAFKITLCNSSVNAATNLLRISLFSTVILCVNISILFGQALELSAVSDLAQVFEDGYQSPETHDSITVFGIRGEVLSAQCLIQAKENLSQVTAGISALRNAATGRSVKPDFIEVNFVGSIALETNTPNQPAELVTRRAPAKFPDYLRPDKRMDVKDGAHQAIWLTIKVPEQMEPGTYTGLVTVKCRQGEQSLPISILVYPLTLPHERSLHVTEWYSTNHFDRFHGISEKYSASWYEMLRTYARNMAEHRQNVFQVPINAIDIILSRNRQLEFEYEKFDNIARIFWQTGKMDYLETGELTRFRDNWFSTEILFKDFEVKDAGTGKSITMTGEQVIPALLKSLENHLRENRWLEKTLFHVRDEPSLHNAAAWREKSSYIHKYAPELKRMDAIETTFVLDDIEVAVPKLDAFAAWFEWYKKAQQKGTEVWFYTVGIYQASGYPNKTIDMPLIDSRLLHWLNYRYDASGYLHWGWNQWTDDPYHDVGEHIGDAWHVYPSKDGVLNSLRWEQMRNGIQDYEYFRMLERKVAALRDSLGPAFAWIDPKQRGKEIAAKVVKSMRDHTKDPNVLYEAKKEVISELMEFHTQPSIYVQTRPEASSTFTDDMAVEVLGWTEPDAEISINGKAIRADQSGFFGERFALLKGNSSISVEVTKNGKSKMVTRDFIIR